MEHDLDKLLEISIEAVRLAYNSLLDLGEEGRIGVKIQGKDEPVTKADLRVSEVWRPFFKKSGIPIRVVTEESRAQGEVLYCSDKPRYLGVGDELDGTGNNQRSKGLVPNCAIFSIFDNLEPFYRDALVSAVLDHNSGNLWHAIRGRGCFFNGQRVQTSGKTILDKETYLYIDKGPAPKPELSLRFLNLEQKCWPRNLSCAGVHLAGVASGSFTGWDGYLSFVQKTDELPVSLLIEEAGGNVTDSNGDPIRDYKVEFNRTYEVIATATAELGVKTRKELLTKEQARSLYESFRLKLS